MDDNLNLNDENVQTAVSNARNEFEAEYPGLESNDFQIVVSGAAAHVELTESGKRELTARQTRENVKEETGAESVQVWFSDDKVHAKPIFGDEPDELQTPDGKYPMTTGEGGGPTVGTKEFARDYAEATLERHIGRNVTVQSIDDDGHVNAIVSGSRYDYSPQKKARAVEYDVEHQPQQTGSSRYTGPGRIHEMLLEREIESQHPDVDVNVYRDASGSVNVETLGREEQFGDIKLTVPGTNKRVESYLREGSNTIQHGISGVASGLFDEGGVASDSIIADGLRATGHDTAANEFEHGIRSFGKGLVEGGGAIADVPGVVLGLKEAGEFAAYGGSEILSGDYEDFKSQTETALVAAGSQAIAYGQKNPFGAAGMVVGSLGGSSTLMNGAERISPRLGTAARWSIQPGEELAGSFGSRVTRTVAGDRAADTLFPGGEPIFMSEETAIRAGKRAKAGVSDTLTLDDATVVRLRSGFADERGQVQMQIQRERPSTTVEEETPTNDVREVTRADFEEEEAQSVYGVGRDDLNERLAEMRSTVPRSDLRASETTISTGMGDVFDVWQRKREVGSAFDTDRFQTTRARRAFESDFESTEPAGFETETTQRQRFRTELRTDQLVGQTQGVSSDVGTHLATDVESDLTTDVVTGLDSEIGVEAETLFESELASESDLSTEFEYESDFASEFEYESESELSTEFEYESEFESEFEQETEQEAEWTLPKNPSDTDQDAGSDWSEWSKRYENEIASSEEVLGWEF
ncbi:hypothetical protein A4G99_03780 [Haladaptatus sp. R4]|uniref:hypothetical protein n=1 Tax=Haladaptatus sp. R4 TaxID=1679489 RepID=UPI0007B464AC|nr:hypothetical protein [Haladaptatus sp. R4]KZN25600.1 hypothetical protein A4G99_03780 [Haladaptatus sp. R4]